MPANRPQDGVGTKFIGPVMSKIVALVPDFVTYPEAVEFWQRVLRRRKVKSLLNSRFGRTDLPYHTLAYDRKNHRYFCWYQADQGIYLSDKRHNPMEVLHLLAHILQPADSAMHKGEFGALFLTLIESVYDADMKRQVKAIMLENNIKTSTKSPEARAKQSVAYTKRITGQKVATIVGKFIE